MKISADLPTFTPSQRMRALLTSLVNRPGNQRVSPITGKGVNDGRNPKHVYAGTVPAHVIAQRRRRNKAARMSRRNNRGSSVCEGYRRDKRSGSSS